MEKGKKVERGCRIKTEGRERREKGGIERTERRKEEGLIRIVF